MEKIKFQNTKLMKIVILLFIFWLFVPIEIFSQIKLTVEIKDLRNNKGNILLELDNDKGEVLNGYSETITNKKSVIVINDLKPGKYAFKYFHDENDDKKINTNFLGIPNEGYGFSNNAKGTFGPPSFDKMVFEVEKSDTILCTPTYILKH